LRTIQGSAIGSTVASINIPHFVQWHNFDAAVILWLGSAILADVVIASSLIWFLRGRKTGIAITDDLVNKLIKSALQTGMLTSTIACVDLVLFLAREDGTHLIFNLPLSTLYTNSFMAILTSRISEDCDLEKANTRGDSAVVEGLQLTTICSIVPSTTLDSFSMNGVFSAE